MGTPQGQFVGFHTCPTCKQKAHHYEINRYDGSKPRRQTRLCFCGNCGSVRFQSLSGSGWVFGTRDSMQILEIQTHV